MSDMIFTREGLTNLVAQHTDAAEYLGRAAKGADGIGKALWFTHGVICGNANGEVSTAEHERRAAVAAVQQAVADLAVALGVAAGAYEDSDQQAADSISYRRR